jgi:hypothetical protein
MDMVLVLEEARSDAELFVANEQARSARTALE